MPLIVSANKKAKLINGTSSAQHHQPSGSASSVVSSDEYQTFSQFDRNNNNNSRPTGPNLVNKQLVLPFVPPSFPNGSSDGNNHLIKPSEYLKSISDKRSSGSSGRWVKPNLHSDLVEISEFGVVIRFVFETVRGRLCFRMRSCGRNQDAIRKLCPIGSSRRMLIFRSIEFSKKIQSSWKSIANLLHANGLSLFFVNHRESNQLELFGWTVW